MKQKLNFQINIYKEKKDMTEKEWEILAETVHKVVKEEMERIESKQNYPKFQTYKKELNENNLYATDREVKNFLLKEEQHYPSFLTPIVDETCGFVEKCFEDWYLNGKKSGESEIQEFKLPENRFFDKVSITFVGVLDNSCNNAHCYALYLPGAKFENGKLSTINIRIICSVRFYANTGEPFIDKGDARFKLSHELEHAYDDWNELRLGNESITRKPVNCANAAFFKDFLDCRDNLFAAVAKIVYLSYYSEQKAFATETFDELSHLGATNYNIRKKIKQCIGYNNYSKIESEFVYAIQNAEPMQLYQLGSYVKQPRYTRSTIPQFNIRRRPTLEDLENYRSRLIKWAENVKKSFMRKFFGVVNFYLEKTMNENYFNPGMVIF